VTRYQMTIRLAAMSIAAQALGACPVQAAQIDILGPPGSGALSPQLAPMGILTHYGSTK